LVVLKLLQRLGWAAYQLKHDQIDASTFLTESRLALAAIEDYLSKGGGLK
jgi:hypothetical protein